MNPAGCDSYKQEGQFFRWVSRVCLFSDLFRVLSYCGFCIRFKKKDIALNQIFKIDICIYHEIQYLFFEILPSFGAAMAEWLRRLTRNQIRSAREGLNPAGCDSYKQEGQFFRWVSRVCLFSDLFRVLSYCGFCI